MNTNFNKTWTLGFLIAVILIDFMGMSTVVVIFPRLLLSSNEIFSALMTKSHRLMWMGVLLALYPLGQIVGAALFGKLSDYYGRKKLLITTLFGTLLSFLASGVSIAMHLPALLFASRLMAGFCAGNVAIAQASILDISSNETRTKNIALGQMAMGSAYIVGPILGAVLSESTIIHWFNSATPFWFFSIILALMIYMTSYCYQDTLLYPKKEKIELSGSIKQIYVALTNARLSGAFLAWMIFVSGWWLFESFMPAFLLQRFDFTTSQIGSVLSFNGALYAAFQYIVVQRCAKRISPATMVKYAGLLVASAIIALVYVNNILALYIVMSVFVMSMGFMIPGIISYIASLADENEQGQTMGMINSIQAVSTVIVMLFGGYLNAMSRDYAVIGGGMLVAVSWLVFLVAQAKRHPLTALPIKEEAYLVD